MTMTMKEILASMDSRRDDAQRIGAAFASEGSPVRMLAEAKRKNTGESPKATEVDRVFAATLPNEIKQAKASLKRFTS